MYHFLSQFWDRIQTTEYELLSSGVGHLLFMKPYRNYSNSMINCWLSEVEGNIKVYHSRLKTEERNLL